MEILGRSSNFSNPSDPLALRAGSSQPPRKLITPGMIIELMVRILNLGIDRMLNRTTVKDSSHEEEERHDHYEGNANEN